MIKLVILIVLCLCIVLIGYCIFLHLKRRRDLFKELESIVDNIKDEIVFRKNFLSDIIKKLNLSQELKQIFDEDYSKTPFTDDEKKEIEQFFSLLGKSDIDGEKSKLEQAKEKFKHMGKLAENQYEKNGKLAIKLCTLFAIALFIFLI